MLVKRYHAKDMQEAMDTVIKELGSEAVILSSRKVRKKGFTNLFRKPIMEVMVAYDPADTPAANRAYGNYKQVSAPSEPEKDLEELASELTKDDIMHLDQRIDSLDEMLSSFIEKFSFIKREIAYDYSPDVETLLLKLIESQVREELAHSIAKETDAVMKKQHDSNASEIMEDIILEQIGTPEPIVPKKFKQKIVLLIGPTGVGKTTSIVKLASNFALNQKRKVGIINTDTYRIAAKEQLKIYTDILHIPLSIVYHPSELSDEIASMADRDIIFIDTAGKRPGDEQHREDITAIIETAQPEDILLCISATTNFSAIREIIDTYSFVEDYRIIITKLDETQYKGGILNLSWYAKKNLAYATTGQNVPDDIELIDPAKIASQVLGK